MKAVVKKVNFFCKDFGKGLSNAIKFQKTVR